MSANVFMVSDTHFGHAGVCKFTRADGVTKLRPWTDPAEMDEAMVAKWNAVVRPQDKVYHLGDVVINRKSLDIMKRLNGSKRLIRGNHDIFKTRDYLEHFTEVYGCRVLADMILTHIPLALECITERFKTNVHGHLHANKINNPHYLCVCVEQTDFAPISIDVVRERIKANREAAGL